MQSQTNLKSFPCKLHPSEPVQRVLLPRSAENSLRCVECILENIDKAPKSEFVTLNDFLEEALKYYASNTKNGSQALEGKVPNELLEVLSSEGENIEKLKQHVEQEKAKVIDIFDSLQKKFTQVCQAKKEEICKQLDLQVETLKLNYRYYDTTVKKHYNKEIDKVDKDVLVAKINHCNDTNDLETFIKTIKDDLSQTVPEPNSLKASLQSLAEELNVTSQLLPKTAFVQENYQEEYLTKFESLINPFIESCSQITSKIDALTFTPGLIVDSKILLQSNLDLLNKWIGHSSSLKLLYRGSQNGFSVKSFHDHCDNYENTLVVIKTEEGKVYGGFSDQLWNDNEGISRQSHNSWLFSLSEKVKYTLPSEWPAPITGTFGAGFCFGGRQDLEIIFSHTLLPYPNPNPSVFNYKKKCYGRFTPIVYVDSSKNIQRNHMMLPGMPPLFGNSQQKIPPMLSMKQFPLPTLPTPKIQPLDIEQIRKNQQYQISCFEKSSQVGHQNPLQMLQMHPPPLLGLPGSPQNSYFAVIEVEVFYIVPEGNNTPEKL